MEPGFTVEALKLAWLACESVAAAPLVRSGMRTAWGGVEVPVGVPLPDAG